MGDPTFQNTDTSVSSTLDAPVTGTGTFSGKYMPDEYYNWLKGLTPDQVSQLTPDEQNARDAIMHINEGGYDAPTWTREDLWHRLAGARNRIAPHDPGAGNKGGDQLLGRLGEFYKQLMGPLPDNDPTAQYIQRHAVNAAQRYGGAAGMNGRSTLGAGAASAQYTQGMQAYDFQRKQLAAQVSGLMNQRDIGLKELQLGYDKFNADLAEKQWAAQQNTNQGIGAGIGAGIMAIPGIALAGYTGGASLGLIGAGATMGGGLGGLASGGSGPSYRPKGIGNYGTGY